MPLPHQPIVIIGGFVISSNIYASVVSPLEQLSG